MNILANVCVFPTKLELDLFLFLLLQLLVQQFLHTHSHRVTRLKCNWNVSFIYAYTHKHAQNWRKHRWNACIYVRCAVKRWDFETMLGIQCKYEQKIINRPYHYEKRAKKHWQWLYHGADLVCVFFDIFCAHHFMHMHKHKHIYT